MVNQPGITNQPAANQRLTSAPPLAPAGCVARYAERLLAVAGDRHHVASPVGAWMLVALCARSATGAHRDELAAVLGMDPDSAAMFVARLLEQPHPAVASALAVWTDESLPETSVPFLASLPVAVERGARIPTQRELDR